MWRPGGAKPKQGEGEKKKVEGSSSSARKSLSKNVLGLKFMARKQEAAEAARLAAKRRREEAMQHGLRLRLL